jgi:AmmeMemoRadiSam system protein B
MFPSEIFLFFQNKGVAMATREPAVAGMFYPSGREELLGLLEEYTKRKPAADVPGGTPGKTLGEIHGLIVPHAGYEFSGPTAGKAYALLKDSGRQYKRALILCPNHTVFLDRIALDSNDAWETLLGTVPVDSSAVKKLEGGVFTVNSLPHLREHAAEVQVPFLQFVLGKIKIVPMVVGLLDGEGVDSAAEKITGLLDDETLLVISTDLSHFLSGREAKAVDAETIGRILSLDSSSELDACGENALKVMMGICRRKRWKPQLVDYTNSGIVTGSNSRVVGYASFWF